MCFFRRDSINLQFTLFLIKMIALGMICLALAAPCVKADIPGVTESEILIGQSCPLKGSAKALGLGMRNGAQAWFKHINRNGGIKGRRIRLISYNDGNEADTCRRNTETLIATDRVFLLFGYVGPLATEVAVRLAIDENVPFFAPLSGSGLLRSPVNPWVFNLRASYEQEIDAIVQQLVHVRRMNRMAVFFQDDPHGRSGVEIIRRALAGEGLQLLAEARYPRNTLEVEAAVQKLYDADPDAVILLGSYQPCAKFIRLMRNAGSRAMFMNVSGVGADALGQRLINQGLGVVITQVVPYPYDTRIPVVAEYNRLLAAAFPGQNPSFPGMEGFLAAKTLCRVLESVPGTLTREEFVKAAERLTLEDIGQFMVSFSPTNHQASNLVYFSQIGPAGFIRPIHDLNRLYVYRP